MSTRSSAAALLAAVFFAGIAVTLGTLRVTEQRQQTEPAAWEGRFRGGPRGGGPPEAGGPFGPGFPGGVPGFARMELTDRLARRLDLTDEQRAGVEAAMEERQRVAAEAMESVLPQLRSQMDSLQQEIEGLLTEEQLVAFREFSARGQDHFRRRGGRGGRPPIPN